MTARPAAAESVDGDGTLTVDRLPDQADPVQVHRLQDVELERGQHVVGTHLERFGRRDELAVTWTAPERSLPRP